jgi:hypothetical protein
MKEERLDPEDIGKQLGTQSVDTVVGKLQAYCTCEKRRIELTNAPHIAALGAEGHLLLDEKKQLEERLRHAPPAFDSRTRKRKAIYYWTVALVLWATGLFSTLMSLAPFRLGWLATVFCIGMAVVSPFLIETALKTWNIEKLLKYLATVASVAALTSLMCFAVIRGNLLSEQLQNTDGAVILEDSPPTPAAENRFYEHVSSYLVLAMLMGAAAMEIGAGLSLYEAWRMSSHSSDDWDAIRDRLALVIARLLDITYEIKHLQNEAAIFVERFERNFYYAMLTHTVRSAVTKLLVAAAILAFLFPSHAYADSHLTLVIAVDLSRSVAVRGADQPTEFQKNIVAITRLLSQVPAGTTVTVIGITDHSFSEPDVLLATSLPSDPGYFGERLRAAQNQLVQAWQQRSARLEPRFFYTDILGILLLASEIFGEHNDNGPQELIIFSDMRQNTSDLNLESATSRLLQKNGAKPKGIHLRRVQVCVLGVDGAWRSIAYWQNLREFWTQYLREAEAELQCYSALRNLPRIPIVLK